MVRQSEVYRRDPARKLDGAGEEKMPDEYRIIAARQGGADKIICLLVRHAPHEALCADGGGLFRLGPAKA